MNGENLFTGYILICQHLKGQEWESEEEMIYVLFYTLDLTHEQWISICWIKERKNNLIHGKFLTKESGGLNVLFAKYLALLKPWSLKGKARSKVKVDEVSGASFMCKAPATVTCLELFLLCSFWT